MNSSSPSRVSESPLHTLSFATHRWIVPLFLLVVSLFSYGLTFTRQSPADGGYSLGFVQRGPIDEEAYFFQNASPDGAWIFGGIDLYYVPVRPLRFYPWWLGSRLFGWHFEWYLLLPVLLQWANALLYWGILCMLLPERRWFALSASLLFLVFPAESTRTVLSMSNMGRAIFYYLGAVWVLLALARRPRWVWWALMPVAVLLSLLSYEQLLPVIGLTPLALWGYRSPPVSREKVRVAAVWWLAVVVWLAWRATLIPTVGLHHCRPSCPSFTVGELVVRYLGWLRSGVLGSWPWALAQVRAVVSLRDAGARSVPLLFSLGVPLVVALFGWLLRPGVREREAGGRMAGDVRAYAGAMLAGLLFAALSYILSTPLIYAPPTDNLAISSRFNGAPIVGLALALAGLLFLVARLVEEGFARVGRGRVIGHEWLAWGLVALLSAVGVVWHTNAVRFWIRQWEETASVWREVVSVAPDVEPDTLVVLIDPPYAMHLRGCTFITGMAQNLYEDSSVVSDFAGGAKQPVGSITTFHDEYAEVDASCFNPGEARRFAYDQVVLVQFGSRLEPAWLVECVPERLLPAGMEPPCTDPDRAIRHGPPGELAQHWLFR